MFWYLQTPFTNITFLTLRLNSITRYYYYCCCCCCYRDNSARWEIKASTNEKTCLKLCNWSVTQEGFESGFSVFPSCAFFLPNSTARVIGFKSENLKRNLINSLLHLFHCISFFFFLSFWFFCFLWCCYGWQAEVQQSRGSAGAVSVGYNDCVLDSWFKGKKRG